MTWHLLNRSKNVCTLLHTHRIKKKNSGPRFRFQLPPLSVRDFFVWYGPENLNYFNFISNPIPLAPISLSLQIRTIRVHFTPKNHNSLSLSLISSQFSNPDPPLSNQAPNPISLSISLALGFSL